MAFEGERDRGGRDRIELHAPLFFAADPQFKAFPRVAQTAPDCGLGTVHQLRDRRDGELVVIEQQDRDALKRGKRVDHPGDDLRDRFLVDHRLGHVLLSGRRLDPRVFVVERQAGQMAVAAQLVEADICCDPAEPGRRQRRILQGAKALKGDKIGLLNGVERVLLVCQDSVRVIVDVVAGQTVQLVESLRLAPADLSDNVFQIFVPCQKNHLSVVVKADQKDTHFFISGPFTC